MPARPEDRTTINIGADLIRAIRQRAQEEGRGFSDVVAAAVTAYLKLPARLPGEMLPDLVPADTGLQEEVHFLLAAVRDLVPRVTAAVENHNEVLDTLDEITSELGRRQGAALALEQAAALAPKAG